MAYFLGIDIGSGYSKAVVLEDTALRSYEVMPSGGDYKQIAAMVAGTALQKINLSIEDVGYVVATGYGASMVDFANRTLTDISCHGAGVYRLFPSVKTVVDIGTQYTRIIRLDSEGRIANFIMNEKCAGGSGKFLQIIAKILHMKIEDIGDVSLTSTRPVEFTTACAVFAESEAVSRISEGALPADILAGLHNAMASKIVTLVTRMGTIPDIAVTGGGAKDKGLVMAIENELKKSVIVAEEPQITAAWGAALFASEKV